MDIELRNNEGHTLVALRGRFVFDCHRDFRGVMNRSLKEAGDQVHLDLGGVDYLDSAALGMLHVLNDKARTAGKKIMLCNSQGAVKELLSLARIDQLFATA